MGILSTLTQQIFTEPYPILSSAVYSETGTGNKSFFLNFLKHYSLTAYGSHPCID